MGYCYTQSGMLCCDNCDNAGGVRKIRCPFGYCPAPALCAECKKKLAHTLTRAAHRANGCEERIRESEEREALTRAYMSKGIPVRCSALGVTIHGVEKVHVLFTKDAMQRDIVGFYMSPEAYAAIPFLVVATPDDYRKYGELFPAPSDFEFARA